MNEIAIDPEMQLPALKTEVMPIASQAANYVILDQEDWALGMRMIKETINPLLDKIESIFDPGIAYYNEKHKKLTRDKREASGSLLQAKADIQGKMKKWELDQMELRRQENLRIERENREREEQLRRDLARQEEERKAMQAKADEEARAIAQENSLKEALRLEKDGKIGEAEALLNKPLQVSVPVVSLPQIEDLTPPTTIAAPVPEVQKADGMKKSKTWTFALKSVDPLSIRQMNPEYLVPNEQKIRKLVKAMGPAAEEIVGNITVKEDITYRFDR